MTPAPADFDYHHRELEMISMIRTATRTLAGRPLGVVALTSMKQKAKPVSPAPAKPGQFNRAEFLKIAKAFGTEIAVEAVRRNWSYAQAREVRFKQIEDAHTALKARTLGAAQDAATACPLLVHCRQKARAGRLAVFRNNIVEG